MPKSKAVDSALSYRARMQVTTIRRFQFVSPPVSFPICPRCQHTLEREYQSFCDRCGQALSWKHYPHAVTTIVR